MELTGGRNPLVLALDRLRARHVRGCVADVVSAHDGALPGCARGARVTRTEFTSTGVVIAMLGERRRHPCAVVKLPLTAEASRALEHEAAVLKALAADERLDGWRDLLPRVTAQGAVGSQRYRVDTALPGVPGTKWPREPGRRRQALVAAAEAIHVLHRATARMVSADEGLAARWVVARARELSTGSPKLARALRDIEVELCNALAGRELQAGWVHGDFWLGNVLFVPGEEVTPRGIVDWDGANDLELPVLDVLHLLLYTRRLNSGRELGAVLRDGLLGAPWSDEERDILQRYGPWCHEGALSERHMLLLYWLRHAAHHARQQADRDGRRYRAWERHNVQQVLEAACG